LQAGFQQLGAPASKTRKQSKHHCGGGAYGRGLKRLSCHRNTDVKHDRHACIDGDQQRQQAEHAKKQAADITTPFSQE
jgi:hypothetical protein